MHGKAFDCVKREVCWYAGGSLYCVVFAHRLPAVSVGVTEIISPNMFSIYSQQ